MEKDTAGFTMGPKMRGIGWRGLDTRELFFDDVWVGDDHLIGDPDDGAGPVPRTLEVGRISIAALSLSLTQAVLDMAMDYARQRVQFGQPISKFQAIQFKLADIATELEAARWLTYRAAYLRDTGQPFLKEAAMAKLKASRLAVWAASEAVQIHGGLGYMLESPVARFYCDAKVLEIGEGTNEIQHLVIARALGLLSVDIPHTPARRRIAAAMSSRSGSQARSRSGAYGGGVGAAPIRSIGASRSQNAVAGDGGGDLGADAERDDRLVGDQESARLVHRVEDRTHVERCDGSQVDHLDRDAFARELLGGGDRLVHHP